MTIIILCNTDGWNARTRVDMRERIECILDVRVLCFRSECNLIVVDCILVHLLF